MNSVRDYKCVGRSIFSGILSKHLPRKVPSCLEYGRIHLRRFFPPVFEPCYELLPGFFQSSSPSLDPCDREFYYFLRHSRIILFLLQSSTTIIYLLHPHCYCHPWPDARNTSASTTSPSHFPTYLSSFVDITTPPTAT